MRKASEPRSRWRRTCVAALSGRRVVRGSPGADRGPRRALRGSPEHRAASSSELGGRGPVRARPGSRRGVEAGRLGERVGGGRRRRRRSTASPERSSGLVRSLEQPLRRARAGPAPTTASRSRARSDHRLDLADLIGQQVLLAFPLAGSPRRAHRARACIAPPLPCGGAGGDRDQMRVAGEPVEEPRLRGRGPQTLRLMLAVHLDERAPQVGERGGRGELPADAGTALPVRTDGPRQDDLAVLRPLRRAGARSRRTGPGRERPSRRRRTRCAARRGSPNASAMATVTMVLPAPVSPVRTFRPGCSSRSRSSMTPRPLMCSSRSTARDPIPRVRHPPSPSSPSVGSPGQLELVADPGEERGASARRTSRAGRSAPGCVPGCRPAARRSRARRPTGAPGSSPFTSSSDLLVGAEDERAVEHHVRGDRGEHDAVARRGSRWVRGRRRSTR